MSPSLPRINLIEARRLLSHAVYTQGNDFVYQDKNDKVGCLNVPYTDELAAKLGLDKLCEEGLLPAADSPKRRTGCMVGTALALAGVPVPPSAAQAGVWYFRPFLTELAAKYLRVAQMTQDQGLMWGTAFEMAEMWADHLVAALRGRGVELPEEEYSYAVREVAEDSTAFAGVGADGES